MDTVLSLGRIGLAGAWGVAAVGKMLDWKTIPPPLARMNVPRGLVRSVSLGLPLLELLLAALLLNGRAAWVAAVLSLGLLLGFTAVLAIAAARGIPGGCGCLGRFERPAPPVAALIRTELLTALAGGIVWLGWDQRLPNLASWLIPTHEWQWLLIAGVLGAFGLTGLIEKILRRARAAMSPHAGLAVGTPAPIPYHPQGLEALVFIGERCPPCDELLGTLPARTNVSALRILSINGRGGDTAREYGVPGIPAAVLIGPDGRVVSRLAIGVFAVRALLGGR